MSEEENESIELQHLGKPKKKITEKQLKAGLNNLKKGPEKIIENSIKKIESENIPYNLNNFYSSIEKYTNQLANEEISKDNKLKKKEINTNKKLIDKINMLENQISNTNNMMNELLLYKLVK